jgi:hypothetical protein
MPTANGTRHPKLGPRYEQRWKWKRSKLLVSFNTVV